MSIHLRCGGRPSAPPSSDLSVYQFNCTCFLFVFAPALSMLHDPSGLTSPFIKPCFEPNACTQACTHARKTPTRAIATPHSRPFFNLNRTAFHRERAGSAHLQRPQAPPSFPLPAATGCLSFDSFTLIAPQATHYVR